MKFGSACTLIIHFLFLFHCELPAQGLQHSFYRHKLGLELLDLLGLSSSPALTFGYEYTADKGQSVMMEASIIHDLGLTRVYTDYNLISNRGVLLSGTYMWLSESRPGKYVGMGLRLSLKHVSQDFEGWINSPKASYEKWLPYDQVNQRAGLYLRQSYTVTWMKRFQISLALNEGFLFQKVTQSIEWWSGAENSLYFTDAEYLFEISKPTGLYLAPHIYGEIMLMYIL